MSDYIERKSIRNLYSYLDPEGKVRVAQVLIDIDAIPSTDAVEVIRCKDCKWFDADNTGEDYCMSANGLCNANAETYCSYGERKETDHE